MKTKILIDTPDKDKTKKKYGKKRGGAAHHSEYKTADGHPLTPLEAKFIDLYIETGNARQSVLEAGYKTTSPGQYASKLVKKDYIAKEIAHRLKQLEDAKIASAEEILQFYTRVMRGEEKDQFGLDAPLSERIKAGNELAKRKIDIVNKVTTGREVAEVRIALNWEGMDDDESGSDSDSENE